MDKFIFKTTKTSTLHPELDSVECLAGPSSSNTTSVRPSTSSSRPRPTTTGTSVAKKLKTDRSGESGTDVPSLQLVKKWLSTYTWCKLIGNDGPKQLLNCKYCTASSKCNVLASKSGKAYVIITT